MKFRNGFVSCVKRVVARAASCDTDGKQTRRSDTATLASSVYLHDLQPLFVLSRIAALFPLQIGYDGSSRQSTNSAVKNNYFIRYPVFKKKSLAMVYATAAYLFWLTCLVLQIILNVRSLKLNSKWDSNRGMIFFRMIAYSLSIPVLPLTNWKGMDRVVRYLNAWSEFELQHRRITGAPLVLNLRKKCVISCAIVVTLIPIYVLRHAYVQNIQDIWHVPVIIYSMYVRIFMDMIWIFSFEALTTASQSLAYEMRIAANRTLHHLRSTNSVLTNYEMLWQQLSSLVRDTGDALHGAQSVAFFTHFLLATLCCYNLVTGSSGSLDLCVQAAASLLLSYRLTNGAHLASKHARMDVQKELEALMETGISHMTGYEVFHFLKTMEMNQPNVNLGGYLVVNKSFLATLVSTLVTYLVVLIQVKMSIQ